MGNAYSRGIDLDVMRRWSGPSGKPVHNHGGERRDVRDATKQGGYPVAVAGFDMCTASTNRRPPMRLGMIIAAMLTVALPLPLSAQGDTLVPALERLAAANDPQALYYLGMAYHLGLGAPKDPARALDAFRRGAALGDPLASYQLGCYYHGHGENYAGQAKGLVTADRDLALRYKLVAAEAGYDAAQKDVASIYGARGDTALAMSWLDKAIAQGGWPALLTGSSAYNGASGVPRDAVKQVAYFLLYFELARPRDAQVDLNAGQQAWLRDVTATMTADELDRVDAMVQAYRPVPTDLTVRARAGLAAAQALVAARAGH